MSGIEQLAEKLRREAEYGANSRDWDKGYNAGLKAAAEAIENRSVETGTEHSEGEQ